MADRNATANEPGVAAPARAGPGGVLTRRWPTGPALLVSAPGFVDAPSPSGTAALAEAMLLLPCGVSGSLRLAHRLLGDQEAQPRH